MHSLAIINWILAKSHNTEERAQLYKVIENKILLNKDDLKIQDISMIIWSFAKN